MRMVRAASILCLVLSGTASALPQSSDRAVPLPEAIEAFNKKAANDYIGKDEAPLTEEEVIAAIRASVRPSKPAVSDNLYNAFKQIAETRQLPPGAVLENNGGLHDPGGEFVYDVWKVRIWMPMEAGVTYSFGIRERTIRSRTLKEELVKIEKVVQEARPWPGLYRLEERIEELKARIAKMNAK